MVKALQNSLGSIVVDPDEMRSLANDFYRTLYTTEGVQGIDEVLNHAATKSLGGDECNVER